MATPSTMFGLFQARAEAVSAVVTQVADRGAALCKVVELCAAAQVGDEPGARVVWCAGPLVGRLDGPARAALGHQIPGLSFEVTRDRAADSRVGVTELDWAIAETGTLAQDATDPRTRLASTLPPIHVALVRCASLLPDLASLLGRVDPRRMRYLSLITGPSRTADIERVLTIGVHGPRQLHIVAVGAEA